MFKIDGLDPSDPLSIVKHLMLLVVKVARFDQGVKNNVAIKVYDADPSQTLTFVGQNSLAIKG